MDAAGDKVILRGMKEQDRELLLNLVEDPEITKVTGGYPCSLSCDRQMRWFCSLPESAGNLRGIIGDKESPAEGLGIIILSDVSSKYKTAEIYIKLIKSARRKGYGQDAVNVLVSYAFHELGLKQIYANILKHNLASRRLFEKCGFKQEGTYKSREYKEGRYRNVCKYEIKNI